MSNSDHLKLFDAFISYSRSDSKAFVLNLHEQFLQQGLKVWVDHHDIPPAVDWQLQIQDGIERSHNFIFVIAPNAVSSKYCLEELAIAVHLKKRIIPLLHRRVERDQRPEALCRLNWIYCQEEDDQDTAFHKLLESIHQDRAYVELHTILLLKALRWLHHQKRIDYLLVGEERQQAETWLQQQFDTHQAPCEPTDDQCDYICESTKNANHYLTDIFISYASQNRDWMVKIRASLMRTGLTIWTDRTDIKTGKAFQEEIKQGIEGADSLVYLLSSASLQSLYCQAELAYAKKLNKRIIPIRLEPVAHLSLPSEIQDIQLIDYSPSTAATPDSTLFDQLLRSLREDSFYYTQSKNLLVKALKWQRQNYNSSILLRGHNLQHYTAWLQVAQSHKGHQPIALQMEFLQASQVHPPESSLDVFISYSQADADFARRLNEALQLQGKTTWFDQESIPSGSNYQEEIYQGIQAADNFLFLISPRSIRSPYCEDEVHYAHSLGKRLLTVLYQPVDVAEIPKLLAPIQWVDFSGDRGDFYTRFSELVRNLDTDRDHVKHHTKWLLRSREWLERGKNADLLLRGHELAIAAEWLQTAQVDQKQPPVTPLQQELIHISEQAVANEIKREKHRVFVLRSLLGVVSGALAIAVGLGVEAYREFQRASTSEVSALSRSADALFASDQQLDALLSALEARQNLTDLHLHRGTITGQVDAVLSKIVYRIVEANRLTGHAQEVFDVVLRPDNHLIATTSADRTIKLWRPDGVLVQTLTGHQGAVWCVAFSPDGRTLISGGADRHIKIWQQTTNEQQPYKLVQTLTGHQATIYDVQFYPNGHQFASGSGDSTVKLWELGRSTAIATLNGHTNEVYTVAFSPDGQQLATGGGDKQIKLWQRSTDGNSYVEQRILTGHQGWISKLAFSPDGQLLASASADQSLKLWQPQTGQILHTLNGHTDVVWSVIWAKHGRILISGSWDRTIRAWNQDGLLLATLQGHQQRVRDLDISQDDSFVVSASADETVKIWQLPKPLLTIYRDHAAGLVDVAAAADVIATTSDDQTIKLWRSAPWGTSLPSPIKTLKGHENGVLGVAVSPDGQWIASASWDHTVKLWKRDGTLLTTLNGSPAPVNRVTISPDGQLLASADDHHQVNVWERDPQNPRQMRLVQTLLGHTDRVLDVAFSPNERYLASASADQTIRLWPISKTGDRWTIGSPTLLTGHTAGVNRIAFSPDNQWLASASDDNTIRLWQLQWHQASTPLLAGIEPGLVLRGHTKEVRSVAFHPTQAVLASGSLDETVKLWDLKTGQLIKTLNGHEAAVRGVTFTPDSQLLSVSRDRTMIAWNVTELLKQDRILADACRWAAPYLRHHPQAISTKLSICTAFIKQEKLAP